MFSRFEEIVITVKIRNFSSEESMVRLHAELCLPAYKLLPWMEWSDQSLL